VAFCLFFGGFPLFLTSSPPLFCHSFYFSQNFRLCAGNKIDLASWALNFSKFSPAALIMKKTGSLKSQNFACPFLSNLAIQFFSGILRCPTRSAEPGWQP